MASLQHLLNCDGHAAASVSIDDFYVRGSQQEELAAKHPDNGLLQFRGNPGTHDLDLAETTLGTHTHTRSSCGSCSSHLLCMHVCSLP